MTTPAFSSELLANTVSLKDLVQRIKDNLPIPDPLVAITFELNGTPYEAMLSVIDSNTLEAEITLGDFSIENIADGSGWGEWTPAALLGFGVPGGRTTLTLSKAPRQQLRLKVSSSLGSPLFVAGFGRVGQRNWLSVALKLRVPSVPPGPDVASVDLPVASKAIGGEVGIGDVSVSFATPSTPVDFTNQYKALFGNIRDTEMSDGLAVTKEFRLAVTGVAYLGRLLSFPFLAELTGNGEIPKLPNVPFMDPAVSGSSKVMKWISSVSLQKIGFSIEPFGWGGSGGGGGRGVELAILPQIVAGLGPIQVDLSGLAFLLKWRDGRPDFTLNVALQGLGLAMDLKAINLRGSLLRSITAQGEGYTGHIFVGVGIGNFKLSMSALGGYFKYPKINAFSLFLYAMLGISKKSPELAAAGGPFQITAIVFGFGLNYELIIPTIEGLEDFPLIRAATDSSFLGAAADPSEVLAKIDSALGADPGTHWGAAGCEMLLFGMIRGFVLLILQGKEGKGLTDIAILAAFDLQKKLAGKTIVSIGILVKAHVALEAGMAEIRAQIAAGSYFLTPNCQVRGGIAFCIWWKPSPYAGDWVFTVGGYHPRYPVPSHYPMERRLGVYFSPTRALQFEAEIYLAIARSAFMIGGKLSFVFKTGPLRAWALFFLDALVSWDPVYFDIAMGISLGAGITIWFFGKRTISVSLGVKLYLWGPPIAGRAEFKVIGIKFSFSFGDRKASHTPPLAFGQFVDSLLLPKPTATRSAVPSVVNIQFEAGVVTDLTHKDSRVADYIVDPEELAFSIHTQVPVKTATLNGSNLSGSWSKEFGVQPCDLKKDELQSACQIGIKDWTSRPINSFNWSPDLGSSPLALWDPQGRKAPVASRNEAVTNTLTGFSMKPKPPEEGRKLGPIDVANLIRNRRHFDWIDADILPPYQPARPAIEEIKQTINSSTVLSKRNLLVAALRRQQLDLETDLRLTETAGSAEKFLLGSPVIAPLGR
ncbi:MAG TPA: DUF6603 domain-containing protein [Candidatus Angelobacter sp.]|nr:DUF6603 domain-containing protein [Candidatus Angelobacter sp.]